MPSLLHYLTTLFSIQPVLASPFPHSLPGHLGAVASESSICSSIGTELLKCGGNAADAMVGTTFCVGVIGMYHSGIGGGGFMLVRGSNGSYEFIDFRETAPAAAFEDMYKDDVNASIYGGLASGVPGELRGLHYLHKKYGKLSWPRVVLPAVKVAHDGFPVTEDLVRYMKSAIAGIDNFLVNDPTWAIDFAPNGTLLTLNDTITRKRYAKTLKKIAFQGPDVFYEGPMAEATIAALTKANGTMTLEDLKNYTVAIRKPAQIDYRGYKLTSTSAPSSGGVALSIMKIVEGFEDFNDARNVNLSTHRLDEAIRWGYGERALLGDPSYTDSLQSYEDSMLSAATAAAIRAKISDSTTHNVSWYDPKNVEILETPGTSHVVTADYTGMSISLTTTVNLLFGSHLMVPETGVIMNNEMNDFSIPGVRNAFGLEPSVINYVKPGKRPLSSITPTIVEHLSNGSLYFSLGAAGGSRIITATVQNLWHVLDGGKTTPEALKEPRLHDQLVPYSVSFEYLYDNSTAAFMQELGHNVSWVAPGQSTAQALRMLPNGTFEAAGEPRQKNSGGFVV